MGEADDLDGGAAEERGVGSGLGGGPGGGLAIKLLDGEGEALLSGGGLHEDEGCDIEPVGGGAPAGDSDCLEGVEVALHVCAACKRAWGARARPRTNLPILGVGKDLPHGAGGIHGGGQEVLLVDEGLGLQDKEEVFRMIDVGGREDGVVGVARGGEAGDGVALVGQARHAKTRSLERGKGRGT